MKKALITGVTGQDGSYLAELLLSKGYEVHGIKRRASLIKTDRIDHIYQDPHEKNVKFILHYGDMTDSSNLNRILDKVDPDEIYNLAAQSHVKVSFEVPEYTADVDALGTLRLLDAIKEVGVKCRFYQASTSEMFGNASESPQSETTPFDPESPYAAAKVFSHWVTKNYRDAYNLFACNGILFNHESPRRGETFVTRKITRAVANIAAGNQDRIYLGNLNAQRDWGFAPEYVEVMWEMLNHEMPDDYVVATGESHTVREFTKAAFNYAGYDITWEGTGKMEKGLHSDSGDVLVEVDPRYFRPVDVEVLCGDSSKAERKLGWRPKIGYKELVKIMMDADMRRTGLDAPGEGDKIIEDTFQEKWWGGD